MIPETRQDDQADTPWLEQGSVFQNVTSLPLLDGDAHTSLPTPFGVVVVSQTCDNVRSSYIQVAPVVALKGADWANAASGRSARHATLPGLGDMFGVELGTIASINKSFLAEADRKAGVVSLRDSRALAQAIGRRFSRFAFPDDIVIWLNPLRRLTQSKSGKPESPEGKALTKIRQIRVRSEEGWTTRPYVLSFDFILDEDELPFESEPIDPSSDLAVWVRNKAASEIAARLENAPLSEHEFLLHSLCTAWIAKCQEKTEGSPVQDWSVDLHTADEYSVASYWDSEALDFDHLSPEVDPLSPSS